MSGSEVFHRLRFEDPEHHARAGGNTYQDRWYVTVAELEAAVEELQDAFLVPRGAAWTADTATFEVHDVPEDVVTVFLEEEQGAVRGLWFPGRAPDELIRFWCDLPHMQDPDWLRAERRAGRFVEATFFGSPGVARVDGRVVRAAHPWAAHVWREHDSWLRPPLPTTTRYLHRGAVLPILDDPDVHFRKAQEAFREAGVTGRADFSPPPAIVCVPGEPFGEGHMCASNALRLGARLHAGGPVMEVVVDGRTRIVPVQRLLRWDGSAFVCVPA